MLNERNGSDRGYLCGAEDIHELDASFQSNVYCEYMKLVNTMDDFIPIRCYDCNGISSIEEIHKHICREIV